VANLSQTAANVALGTIAITDDVTAGEAVTQGMPVYKATDGLYYQCDANASATTAACTAIAITPAATSGKFIIAKPGSYVNLGAALTIGLPYSASATKGAICPTTDLTTGDYSQVIAIGYTSSIAWFDPIVSGVAKP